jgi:hypothetical protein
MLAWVIHIPSPAQRLSATQVSNHGCNAARVVLFVAQIDSMLLFAFVSQAGTESGSLLIGISSDAAELPLATNTTS